MHTINRQDFDARCKIDAEIGQVRTVAQLDQIGSGYFMFKMKCWLYLTFSCKQVPPVPHNFVLLNKHTWFM